MTIQEFKNLKPGTKLKCIKLTGVFRELELNKVYTFRCIKNDNRVVLFETKDLGWLPERFLLANQILNAKLNSGGNL